MDPLWHFDPSELADFDSYLAGGFLASTLARGSAGSAADCEQPATRAAEASAPLLAYDSNAFPGAGMQLSPTCAYGPAFVVAGALPDLQLLTADDGAFCVHRAFLQHASTNAFGGLLAGRNESVSITEPSVVLAVALHIVYGIPCPHSPDTTLETVEQGMEALLKYGVPLESYATPGLPLFQLILAHAPHHPIDAYALAAHHLLEELTAAVSAHLLAYDTSALTDALSVKMGPAYIKRLFELHQARRDALRNIVLKPPGMHPPTLACGTEQQRQLMQAWAFAAAELAWDTLLGSTSTYMLQSVFQRAGSRIGCGECRLMLDTRIREATEDWSVVPRTI